MNRQKCISDADLARLWDGDVAAQDEQALQQHIEICPDCRDRWKRMSAGAKHVESLLSEAAGKTQAAGECLSGDLLTGFVEDTLKPEERQVVEDHLTQCSGCRDALAEKFSDAYAKEGNTWWSEYVGRQILGLLVQLSEEEIDDALEALGATLAPPVRSEAIIQLPALEPAESEARRLAAATGEGFSVQTLHQDEPAFEFELTQFGEQLRITARSLGEDSPYKDCLAKLEFLEQDICRSSRFILIDKGEGRCVIEPDDVRRLRLREGHLALRLEPLITIDQLASAGSDAYIPILSRLSIHKDPRIRRAAVEVIARICGPKARSLIEPLADDDDETVRSAIKKALSQFPQP